MIKYSLRCDTGHRFDSWFANAAAFDGLARAGHLSCAICGSASVQKDIMAPRISSTVASPGAPEAPPASPAAPAPPPDLPAALKALRAAVERDSEYVGNAFAREARAIHDGTGRARSIYGEARPEEARKLLEDGVPVAPLPFIPTKKAH